MSTEDSAKAAGREREMLAYLDALLHPPSSWPPDGAVQERAAPTSLARQRLQQRESRHAPLARSLPATPMPLNLRGSPEQSLKDKVERSTAALARSETTFAGLAEGLAEGLVEAFAEAPATASGEAPSDAPATVTGDLPAGESATGTAKAASAAVAPKSPPSAAPPGLVSPAPVSVDTQAGLVPAGAQPGRGQSAGSAMPADTTHRADPGFDGAWVDGHPPWASGRFECLLFDVAGLRLAVPLVALGGVQRFAGDRLTSVFGSPPWFMGLLQHGGRTIRVVDTAYWIMPEKYPPGFREVVRYTVLLRDCDWGLACSDIADAFALQAGAVHWRGERSRRPWLAGTVIEKMCALLDVAALRSLLDATQRKER